MQDSTCARKTQSISSIIAVSFGPRDDFAIGRAVAAHARLGEPGDADLEKLGRVLGREQDKGRRRRPLKRNVLV
jgi:hypothetical protein